MFFGLSTLYLFPTLLKLDDKNSLIVKSGFLYLPTSNDLLNVTSILVFLSAEDISFP